MSLKINVRLNNPLVFSTDPGNSTVYYGYQVNTATGVASTYPNDQYTANALVPPLSMVSTNPIWIQIPNTTNAVLNTTTPIGNVDLDFILTGNLFSNNPIYYTDYLQSPSISIIENTRINQITLTFVSNGSFNMNVSVVNAILAINNPAIPITLTVSSSTYASVNTDISVSIGDTISFYLPNFNYYKLSNSYSINLAIITDAFIISTYINDYNNYLWMYANLPPSCVDGGSLIQTPEGLKRMDQLTVNDRVMVPEGIYVQIREVVQCQIKMAGMEQFHDALIIEKDALGPDIPNEQLIIDPGHPIANTSNPTSFKPASAYFTEPHYISWAGRTRYDLILEEPYQSYMVHNLMIKSRKARTDAGYDHRYQGSN